MSITTSHKDTERGFALQKYLLLHSQHDALQKHLSTIANSMPTTASSSPSQSPDRNRASSLSSSTESDDSFLVPAPTTHHHRRSGSVQHRRPQLKQRRSSLPALPVIDESIFGEMEADEMKLRNVNQQIKTTLTELLNCESVRSDPRYRMWVQTRLMDAEKELKGDRARSCDRRRSEDLNGMMF